MKKVLIVAYYFPPAGGAGVQRILKYTKYLQNFGWQPYILTVSPDSHEVKDDSFLSEIPENTVIHHSKIFEPYDLYRALTGNKNKYIDVNSIKKDGRSKSAKEKLAEFVRATFFIPDARMFWRFNAIKEGVELIKKYNIDAIYSSSPPYTCEIIGRGIKRKTGLPWVAGPRDPWTGYISAPDRPAISEKIDKALERSVWKEADAVEVAWPGIIEDAIRKYPELEKKRDKFFHNPNGFDLDDYPDMEASHNERFTLTYTGSLFGKASPRAIITAIEKLVKEGKINKENILLRVIGRYGSIEQEMLENSLIKDNTELIPYLPHKESIEYLMKSDSLLMLCSGTPYTDLIVPGKLYEYLGASKPILSISPESSMVAKILIETNAGLNSDETDIDKIAENYLTLYNDWANNTNSIIANEAQIKKYDRRELAKNLAGILNSLV
ncbi:MAG: hypothetical protein B7C24_09780 [Bacteroidetes bacterium 4572_77]|nr:MAG: hypothetical protein B7C24_09780 [Bacteroidetes bacterium 4572_77]